MMMAGSVHGGPPSSLGGGLSTGITRLCKGLVVILVLGSAMVQLFPSAVTYLALIPSRTIPFGWNLVTAGYIERTIPGVVISTVGLLLFGKLLEPLWGPREFLKFIFVVNLTTSLCVFVTAIALYYVTQLEIYLYTPFCGFHGVIAGLLVGIKQNFPDQELKVFMLKIKAKWVPSLVALISVAVALFLGGWLSVLPTLLYGIYVSWIYLRYFQRKPETGLKGDPSDEFSFSSFFPEFMRPFLDPVATILHRLLCGRSEGSSELGAHEFDTSPLPGSDSIEANRRRERGARALEERLAAEKLSLARKAGAGASEDPAAQV